MKFIPKYITTDILAEYGEHLTHEAYNEMVILNSTQGDYNTKILNQLFNTDEGIQIPYLDNKIKKVTDDQLAINEDMDQIVADMKALAGSLSKYTTICETRRMIQNATQGFVKTNKLKAGDNIDIVVDALNNVTISATGGVAIEYVDERDAATLSAANNYTDNAIAQIDLSDYATTQYVDDAIAQIDLDDYATKDYVDNAIADIPIPVVPTNVSAFTNDVGYITSHDIPPIVESDPYFSASPAAGITSQNITAWNNKSDFSGDYNDLTNKPTIPVVPTNVSAFNNDAGYITGYTETDPIFGASAAAGIQATDITAWNNKSDFSGDYNDLLNKPTIPTVPTNVSAFTNDAGYITGYTETDPVFSASAAAGITAADITRWNNSGGGGAVALEDIAAPYSSYASYKFNDLCVYNNQIWEANSQGQLNPPDPNDPSEWGQVTGHSSVYDHAIDRAYNELSSKFIYADVTYDPGAGSQLETGTFAFYYE